MNSCGCCKLEYTNEDGHTPEECANRLSDKVQQLLLQFEEARKIIEQVSYSPEFKKWHYHGKEQDPCGVHAFTAKYEEKRKRGCPNCGNGVTGIDPLCDKHYSEYLGQNRARGNNEND